MSSGGRRVECKRHKDVFYVEGEHCSSCPPIDYKTAAKVDTALCTECGGSGRVVEDTYGYGYGYSLPCGACGDTP